ETALEGIVAADEIDLAGRGLAAEAIEHFLHGSRKDVAEPLRMGGLPQAQAEGIFGEDDDIGSRFGGVPSESGQLLERAIDAGEDLGGVVKLPVDEARFGLGGGDSD